MTGDSASLGAARRAGDGARAWALGAVIAASVATSACDPGPRAQVLLFVDTDLPVPRLADSLLVDVLGSDGRVIDSRNVIAPDPVDWPISLGVASSGVTLRLRAYRADRLGRPELGLGVEGEPVPAFTVDRLVTVTLPEEGIAYARVVLSGRCIAAPPDLSNRTSCVAVGTAVGTAPPDQLVERLASPPDTSLAGTWDEARELPCAGEPRDDTGTFDGEVCVPGGFFFLGDERLRPNECAPVCNGFPELPVRMSPFYLDEHEVTVARWRAALAAGFRPPPGSWGRSGASGGQVLCNYDSTRTDLDEGSREALPMNCLTWEAARAFCEHDGRELVSEARWDYAASGRGEERLYPWGDALPSCDRAAYARYGSWIAGLTGTSVTHQVGGFTECSLSDPNDPDRPVLEEGSRPVGTSGDLSRDRISDLAGNLLEWTLDEGQLFGTGCWTAPLGRDPVCLEGAITDHHPLRGGSFTGGTGRLAVAWRDVKPEGHIAVDVGFRCARSAAP